jgi:tetratricopeptide (TPR) repeat protein
LGLVDEIAIFLLPTQTNRAKDPMLMNDVDSAKDTAVVAAVRDALEQKDAEAARDLFLTLPCLALHHHKWLHDVLRDLYCVGRIEIRTAIAFLYKLPDPLWSLAGCRVVQRAKKQFEWEKTPRVQLPAIALASFVHQLCGELAGDDRVEAETLWHEWFCPTTHAIVLGRPLVVQASARREVLYSVSDASSFDSDRRYVFGWRQQWTPKLVEKEQWLMVPVDNAWERFTIESVTFGELLYVEKLPHMMFAENGTVRRCVFTWRNHTGHLAASDPYTHWQLIPVDGSRQGDFTIYNAATHSYLTSPDDVFNDERRHVLCAPQLGTPETDRVWRVLPQRMTAMDTGVAAFYGGRYDDAERLLTQALEDTDDRLDTDERVQGLLLRAVSRLRSGKANDIVRADTDALERLGGEKAVRAIGFHAMYRECADSLGLSTIDNDTPRSPGLSLLSLRELLEQGDQFFVLREYAKALHAYEEASQITVGLKDAVLQARHTQAQLSLVKCLYLLDRTKEALKILDDLAVRMATYSTVSEEAGIQLLLWRARCERRLQRYANATATLVQALDVVSCLATSSNRTAWLQQSITLELEVVRLFEKELVGQLLDMNVKQEPDPEASDSHVEQLVLSLRCPLSFEFMKDPVMTPSGTTYERTMIEWHLDAVGAWDPMTRMELLKSQLCPNRALKVVIETLLSEHALGRLLAACNS